MDFENMEKNLQENCSDGFCQSDWEYRIIGLRESWELHECLLWNYVNVENCQRKVNEKRLFLREKIEGSAELKWD